MHKPYSRRTESTGVTLAPVAAFEHVFVLTLQLTRFEHSVPFEVPVCCVLRMCVCVCVCVCVCLNTCVCVRACVCVHVHVYVYMSKALQAKGDGWDVVPQGTGRWVGPESYFTCVLFLVSVSL